VEKFGEQHNQFWMLCYASSQKKLTILSDCSKEYETMQLLRIFCAAD
jgi:hypothetical protein